jgi:hypothetical protein
MNTWLLTLPVIGLVTGALLFKVLLNRLLRPAQDLAMQSLRGLFPAIQQRMTDPHQAERVLPLAEAHIDHFLRNKLTTAMPMVAMFIGDKTITQFKGIFMEELAQLLPVFIQAYLEQTLQPESIEPLLKDGLLNLWKRLSTKVLLAGAGIGLIIGLVQWFILYLLGAII